ncbi:MAG: bifunctional DNA-formamidopyrimidine glycosylase/DNA-(apurinic or apyrimidinic site) lyase [Planctomycetes bacterium]|nr:bifunctional DNA-formamidopyrimidine glycosylase/DNA-(apurinic or apyrimidinic site) lyase [Planctomycetota bacterium]
MPELPEVETVRRGLEPLLVGHRFAAVRIAETRLRYPLDGARLRRRVAGRRLLAIERRAKYLIFHLEGERALLAHLGMTGRFELAAPGQPLPAHTHVSFRLDDGRELRFIDPRRFGMLAGLDRRELAAEKLLAHLGPEPLAEAFDGETLVAAARGSRRSIKALLMDGRVVVGVGNIYANEALWRVGILPRRAAGRVAAPRLHRLAETVKQVLSEAIAVGGTTLKDFLDPTGQAGYFRIELSVYDRAGQPCPRCAEPIRRSVIQNRATFHCPRCQR